MKPTELQRKICEVIKIQANYWINTNDIHSPTHYNDIEEDVNDIDDLSDDAKEILIQCLENLYHFIKNHN
jgi:hypothetical protein